MIEHSAGNRIGLTDSLFENFVLYQRVERQVNANKGFSIFSTNFGHLRAHSEVLEHSGSRESDRIKRIFLVIDGHLGQGEVKCRSDI